MAKNKILQLITLAFTTFFLSASMADPPGGGYNYCSAGNFSSNYPVVVGLYFEGCYAVTLFNTYDCSSGFSRYTGTFSTRSRMRSCV